MVNPIFANPTTAARRLTIGGSDWLWVVTVIMGFSALFVLAWSKYVGLTPVSLCTHLTGGCYRPATCGSTSVPLYGRSHPHGVDDSIFRHGI
jgi:hypothetical protein